MPSHCSTVDLGSTVINMDLNRLSALKIYEDRGAWMAQSVKVLTVDFSSSHDFRVVGSSPTLGSALSPESA